MKRLIPLLVLLLSGCGGQPLPSYEELKRFPLDCKKKGDQVSDLKDIMRLKYFDPNIENLNKQDRAYYALLKEHIWWFEYNCNQ